MALFIQLAIVFHMNTYTSRIALNIKKCARELTAVNEDKWQWNVTLYVHHLAWRQRMGSTDKLDGLPPQSLKHTCFMLRRTNKIHLYLTIKHQLCKIHLFALYTTFTIIFIAERARLLWKLRKINMNTTKLNITATAEYFKTLKSLKQRVLRLDDYRSLPYWSTNPWCMYAARGRNFYRQGQT